MSKLRCVFFPHGPVLKQTYEPKDLPARFVEPVLFLAQPIYPFDSLLPGGYRIQERHYQFSGIVTVHMGDEEVDRYARYDEIS